MSLLAVAAAAFGIGFCTGLRCMTPVCVLSLMRLRATGFFASALYWPFHAVVFPLAAVGELIGDKLPKMPSRLAAPGLIGRIFFGAFCGAALSTIPEGWEFFTPSFSIIVGMLFGVLGMLGAVAGAFLGNRFRGFVPKSWSWPAALGEDALAVGGSILVVSLLR